MQKQIRDISINTISLNEKNVLRATVSSDGQYILIPKDGENKWQGVRQYILERIKNYDKKGVNQNAYCGCIINYRYGNSE